MAPPVQTFQHWTLVTSDLARSKRFYVGIRREDFDPWVQHLKKHDVPIFIGSHSLEGGPP